MPWRFPRAWFDSKLVRLPHEYDSIELNHKLMTTTGFKIRRDIRALNRRAREWRMIFKGVASTDHPVMAHIIPIRRCNLACTYSNEYDDFSKPVTADIMFERLDRSAGLGTTIITFSCGEP